jgi:hypothetical protein
MKAYNLVGQDGNAYSLMGYTAEAMRDAYRETKLDKYNKTAEEALMKKAKSGDYNNLICVLDGMIQDINSDLGLEDDELEFDYGYCPACDSELTESEDYCTECGWDIEDE